MELILFRHQRWEQLYNNCSTFDTTTPIPWDQRRFIWDSYIMIVLATTYYILYIPCMLSIRRHLRDENGESNSCYILLYTIGFVDMGALWGITIFNGILFIKGAIYCSYPMTIYLVGLVQLSFTQAEIVADAVLALNRCLDILSHTLADMLFKGKRLWFWICLQSGYGIYYFIFDKPTLFNGNLLMETLNPYHGFLDDTEGNFKNVMLGYAQIILAFSTPIIYLIFAIALWIKSRYYLTGVDRHTAPLVTRTQLMVFLQVFLISLMNAIAGIIYYTLEHFPFLMNEANLQITMRLAHYAWIHMHGLPPVLYILLNRTVRIDIYKFLMKIFKPHKIRRLHGITAIAPSSRQNITEFVNNNILVSDEK